MLIKKAISVFCAMKIKKGYLKEVPNEIVSRFDDSGYNNEDN